MNEKLRVGQQVAARLFPTENSIDDALIASASLRIALITARRDIQEPCGKIQKALDENEACGAALLEARRKIVTTHASIVRLRDDLGLPPTGFGCETPCVELTAPQTEGRLKAV